MTFSFLKGCKTLYKSMWLFLAFILLCFFSSPSFSACPAGSDFLFKNSINRNVRVANNLRDQSIPEGSFMATLPLDLATATASLSLSPDGINTRFEFNNINGRMWRLRVPRSSNLQISDIDVDYRIEDAVGTVGFLSAQNNSNSKVEITASQKNITRSLSTNRIIFRGYINLSGDFAKATHSGRYRGTLISTVDCL